MQLKWEKINPSRSISILTRADTTIWPRLPLACSWQMHLLTYVYRITSKTIENFQNRFLTKTLFLFLWEDKALKTSYWTPLEMFPRNIYKFWWCNAYCEILELQGDSCESWSYKMRKKESCLFKCYRKTLEMTQCFLIFITVLAMTNQSTNNLPQWVSILWSFLVLQILHRKDENMHRLKYFYSFWNFQVLSNVFYLFLSGCSI